MTEVTTNDLPSALQKPLRACAAGERPANIVAMQLLMESRHLGEAEQAVIGMLGRFHDRSHAEEAARLRAVLALLRSNPDAWRTVRTVLDDVKHDEETTDADDAIRRWATAFDRAARNSPEGSVALYALGNPELLHAATAEVLERLRDWRLLSPERTVLEIGCGIGRFGEALADEVAAYVGIDISGEMIAAARRRCAGLSRVSFLQSSGRDLSQFEDGAFDLVLAVDTFPYLVQSGPDLAERHIAEAARVLRPGGDLLMLNFSYRGNPARDRSDVRSLARANGFAVRREGTREFRLWDGAAYHLARNERPPGTSGTEA